MYMSIVCRGIAQIVMNRSAMLKLRIEKFVQLLVSFRDLAMIKQTVELPISDTANVKKKTITIAVLSASLKWHFTKKHAFEKFVVELVSLFEVSEVLIVLTSSYTA